MAVKQAARGAVSAEEEQRSQGAKHTRQQKQRYHDDSGSDAASLALVKIDHDHLVRVAFPGFFAVTAHPGAQHGFGIT